MNDELQRDVNGEVGEGDMESEQLFWCTCKRIKSSSTKSLNLSLVPKSEWDERRTQVLEKY